MVLGCLVGVAIPLAAWAGPAAAAEKGVHFDPGSPAGTEYALPLAQARNEGSGKSGVGKDGSVEPAPLFGEGVGGPGSSAGAAAPGGGAHPAAHPGGNGRAGTGGGGATGGGAGAAAAGRLPTERSYSSGGALLLGALILIAAAGAGYGLRRASGPRSA